MQIVIDIPQKWFDDMVREEFTDIDELCAVIQHGTPLPKGHGAIKDISQIEIPMCEDRAYETWVQVAINAAPTIIEADKAGEGDENGSN